MRKAALSRDAPEAKPDPRTRRPARANRSEYTRWLDELTTPPRLHQRLSSIMPNCDTEIRIPMDEPSPDRWTFSMSYEDDSGMIRLRNCPFHELAQQNRGVVCAMNLSLLEGLLAGLDTNDFSPSLEIEPGRCCVVLRPSAQRNLSQSQPARSANKRRGGAGPRKGIAP